MINFEALFDIGSDQFHSMKLQRRSFLEQFAAQPCTGINFIQSHRCAVNLWDLHISFFLAGGGKILPRGITPDNIRITGMDNLPGFLQVVSVTYSRTDSHILEVRVADSVSSSDLSVPQEVPTGAGSPNYLLTMINVPGIDPFFSSAPFSFRGSTGVDPHRPDGGDATDEESIEIDYMAKDYSSFRRAILDHMSQLVPHWKERHIPDLGIALVEIMAYAGDYLSYYQDAVGTEAYLETARRRVSLQRHTRLLDYRVHNGCNSRLPVQLQVSDICSLPKGTPLLTALPGHGALISVEEYNQTILFRNFEVKVFQTMFDKTFYPMHTNMSFYNWGIRDFTLKKGAVSAALDGHFPNLFEGDLLIFEHRHMGNVVTHLVRLNAQPIPASDPTAGHDITQISWYGDDALESDWMVSAPGDPVTVRGNMILADYGRTIPGEQLPPVPILGNYYPSLKFQNLIYADPFHYQENMSAAQMMNKIPDHAVPAVGLLQDDTALTKETQTSGEQRFIGGSRWTARRDLLSSGPFAHDFVAETEEDGTINLRFGDGKMGRRPSHHTIFNAYYRVGNRLSDRVGPGAIKHLVSDDGRIKGVYNPCVSSAVTPPEAVRHVRINAPEAFKSQERCITDTDWADIAKRHPEVAAVRVRNVWTGSRLTVFLHLQRVLGKPVNRMFKQEMASFMEPYRPAGSDFAITAPYFVGLEIRMSVYLAAGTAEGPVRLRLTRNFSSLSNPDGTVGLFYPDNFTFGRPLYLSDIVDRAMTVRGVTRVEVTVFRRIDESRTDIPDRISAAELEILQLQNIAGSPAKGTMVFDFYTT